MDVRHEMMHHLEYLSNSVIHVDPVGHSGKNIIVLRNMSTGDILRMGIERAI
ncbi:TPA: hypothetical protein HA338_00425 [Methanosarcina acetivorans]|uniref:Uncharacterized protein n=1 Tax=Methanosarcina acetivorans TaxID=2214 RepID=A0A832S7R6_9EURY|nr:hypothetical protein [Methanosarcina acetivorans]HIH92558.1 hypothetical protein [Methanosarcina acetivorans]